MWASVAEAAGSSRAIKIKEIAVKYMTKDDLKKAKLMTENCLKRKLCS